VRAGGQNQRLGAPLRPAGATGETPKTFIQ